MFWGLFALSILLFAGRGAPNTTALVKLLEARYSNVETLRATFLETYREGGHVQTESGVVVFRRPGKMRWEYQSPEEKLFVSDGRTVWFYVPADRSVMRAPAKESSDWRMPFALLTREPKLSKVCGRMEMRPPAESLDPGDAVLQCTPKSDAEMIHEILIEMDFGTGDIRRVLVRESAGVEMDFRFANWERNVSLADKEFKFVAPVGVAIVEGLAPLDPVIR